jgi:hypothetical protein
MLDLRGAIGRWRQRRLFSAGLNTGLFVCADDVIIGTQWSALPDALIKIEDGSLTRPSNGYFGQQWTP